MFVTNVKIKTRLSRIKVKGFFKELPLILSGQVRDKYKIREAFLAGFLESMFDSISKAFIDKSKGGTDELGNSWSPLRPRTVASRLSPKMQKRYPLSRKLWIMRLGERLLRSLKPGDIVGGRYKPPKEQVVKVEGTVVTLGTDVPYAPRQNSWRPLIPSRIKPWTDRAVEAGVASMTARIKELLEQGRI